MTSPWAPRLAGRIRAAEDQVKCTSVCGRARSAVAERTTTAGIWPSVTTRGAVRGSTAAGRNRRRRPCLQRLQWNAALCRRHVGSVRMLAHDLDVDDCPDFRSPPQRMRVMERARQVQGLAGRRVRRARPSEPRAGTVTPLSVRTLTGGDVGIGRDVRPSYVQVGAGARMYGFTPRGGRALPSIRTLDNMDTHVSLEETRGFNGHSSDGTIPRRDFAGHPGPPKRRPESVGALSDPAFAARMLAVPSRARKDT